MKKIFAGIALPTLAAVAVIGSGFSVWFFGENQDKVSTNASIEVQNLLRIGEMGKNSSAVLRLDQTNGVREKILTSDLVDKTTKDGNFDKKSNFSETDFGKGTATNGLYLVGTGTTAFDGEIKYTAPTDGYVDSLADSHVEIKTTFKFEGGIANYVGMDAYNTTTGALKTGWEETDAANGLYVYTWQTETANTLPMLTAGAVSVSTFKFAYVAYNGQYGTLSTGEVDSNRAGATGDYAARGVMATAEPHTDKEYSKMLADVKTGSSLTITTTATIVTGGRA